ncbi:MULTISPECIES: DUF317 domain-containing protein [Streptomyces]|uniref:DUF317 domain-containing protein n=1 Tax=Streptomyces TaxID=1883 RepID=UPI00163C53C6|nr:MULTISPECIES: DUF317 domain-containing protein [Streptomyces]MBC2878054.1 DUF317 domain-containing protein [Streptomyces sp. TYQ1024]UBI40006.1 DUF317 domain-containing protein [Streptomyces mobaraensis]UKW32587.1 DUF317 domain-containing protein [Streptomyces sp. TYQ1024]
MSQPYTPTRARDPRDLIWYATRPRHLAGPGDPRHVTQALRAAGWKNHSAPDYPHVVLASADHRHTLLLEPVPDTYAAWWRISSRTDGQHWHASFGGNTPVEVLAAYTDALIRPAPKAEPEVWSAVTRAGWTYERDEHGSEQALHPDGVLSLRRQVSHDPAFVHWRAEAALPTGLGGQRRLWEAWFSENSPPHLIAAFATALASNEPVQRAMSGVPHPHLVTQEISGPQGEQLLTSHEERLTAARAAARRAASPRARPRAGPAAAARASRSR